MATVPTFTVPGGAANTFDISASDIGNAASIQGRGNLATGELNSQYLHQDKPQMDSSIGAAGQWYSGARRVAQGNQQRQFKDKAFDINFGMYDAMNQQNMNQALTATGFVTV